MGMTVDEAKNAVQQRGDSFRVVEEDGRVFMVTQDYRFRRLNVVVNNGKVSQVKGYF